MVDDTLLNYIDHYMEEGLMRVKPTEAVESGLLENGLATRGVGGLVLTGTAYKLWGRKLKGRKDVKNN